GLGRSRIDASCIRSRGSPRTPPPNAIAAAGRWLGRCTACRLLGLAVHAPPRTWGRVQPRDVVPPSRASPRLLLRGTFLGARHLVEVGVPRLGDGRGLQEPGRYPDRQDD